MKIGVTSPARGTGESRRGWGLKLLGLIEAVNVRVDAKLWRPGLGALTRAGEHLGLRHGVHGGGERGRHHGPVSGLVTRAQTWNI